MLLAPGILLLLGFDCCSIRQARQQAHHPAHLAESRETYAPALIGEALVLYHLVKAKESGAMDSLYKRLQNALPSFIGVGPP